MNCFWLVLIILPQKKFSSLQWAEVLNLNVLKGMFCSCGWHSLLCSLSQVSSTSWDQCSLAVQTAMWSEFTGTRIPRSFLRIPFVFIPLLPFLVRTGLSPPPTPNNLKPLVGKERRKVCEAIWRWGGALRCPSSSPRFPSKGVIFSLTHPFLACQLGQHMPAAAEPWSEYLQADLVLP